MSLADDHQMKKARKAFIDRLGLEESTHGIIELHDDIVSRQVCQLSLSFSLSFDPLFSSGPRI